MAIINNTKIIGYISQINLKGIIHYRTTQQIYSSNKTDGFFVVELSTFVSLTTGEIYQLSLEEPVFLDNKWRLITNNFVVTGCGQDKYTLEETDPHTRILTSWH